MEERINITGYHGTLYSNKDSILNNGFVISNKRDDHWLGHGVYFYKDIDLAIWWSNNVVKSAYRKNKGLFNGGIVFKVIMEPQDHKVLDLDDRSTLTLFNEYCIHIHEEYKKINKEIVVEAKDEFTLKNKLRCIYLDIYKDEHDIDLVMYTFARQSPSYSWNFKKHGKPMDLGLDYKEPQICVYNQKSIKNVYVVYPDWEVEII